MGSILPDGLILHDGFPGVPELNAPKPVGGFDNTTVQCCVTAPAYRPGTKMQAFQDATVGAGGTRVANSGYYTMVYAKYTCYSSGVKLAACDVGGWVGIACGSTRNKGDLNVTNDVTGGNAGTAGVGHAPLALACTCMDNSTYGWFWCGGVCPNYDITALDDLTGFLTDGNVIAGAPIQMDSDVSYAQASYFCSTHAADYLAFPSGFALDDDT